MHPVSPAEELIELVTKTKDLVQSLVDTYRGRPALIVREEKAVRAHDLLALEGLRDEYEAVSAKVESDVRKLKSLFERLADLAARVFAQGQALAPSAKPDVTVPTNVSEALELIDRLRAHIETPELASKILSHVALALAALWQEFIKEKAEVERLIHKNHVALEVLVDNYQKSFRFWQEMVDRTVGSYDAKGMKTSHGRLPGFTARA